MQFLKRTFRKEWAPFMLRVFFCKAWTLHFRFFFYSNWKYPSMLSLWIYKIYLSFAGIFTVCFLDFFSFRRGESLHYNMLWASAVLCGTLIQDGQVTTTFQKGGNDSRLLLSTGEIILPVQERNSILISQSWTFFMFFEMPSKGHCYIRSNVKMKYICVLCIITYIYIMHIIYHFTYRYRYVEI